MWLGFTFFNFYLGYKMSIQAFVMDQLFQVPNIRYQSRPKWNWMNFWKALLRYLNTNKYCRLNYIGLMVGWQFILKLIKWWIQSNLHCWSSFIFILIYKTDPTKSLPYAMGLIKHIDYFNRTSIIIKCIFNVIIKIHTNMYIHSLQLNSDSYS